MLTVLLAATLATLTYVDEDCGFAFDYPATWRAVAAPEAVIYEAAFYPALAVCAVGLQPPKWAQTKYDFEDDYPIRVHKWNKPFIRAARDTWFYPPGGGYETWRVFSTTTTEAPATTFTTKCCRGVRGISVGAYGNEEGSLSSYWWEPVLLNDWKDHSVLIENDKPEEFAPVVNLLIRTMRPGLRERRRTLPADYDCEYSSRRMP